MRKEACNEEVPSEIALFNKEKLFEAASSLQNRKGPGTDKIATGALKSIVHICPQLLFDMYNYCLREGIFHEQWKIQGLVLISIIVKLSYRNHKRLW